MTSLSSSHQSQVTSSPYVSFRQKLQKRRTKNEETLTCFHFSQSHFQTFQGFYIRQKELEIIHNVANHFASCYQIRVTSGNLSFYIPTKAQKKYFKKILLPKMLAYPQNKKLFCPYQKY